MPWGRDLSGNSISKEFVFSPGHLKFHKHSVYGHVGLVTFRPPKKSNRKISPALASIKAELVKRREAGAFENNKSLADRWAKKDLDIDDSELAAGLKEIRTMWKQDLDNLLDES